MSCPGFIYDHKSINSFPNNILEILHSFVSPVQVEVRTETRVMDSKIRRGIIEAVSTRSTFRNLLVSPRPKTLLGKIKSTDIMYFSGTKSYPVITVKLCRQEITRRDGVRNVL